jgi:hypothetical protein
MDPAINSVIEAKFAATQQEIAYALLAKAQAMGKVQAQAATEMLQAAANMGKAIARGQQFDAVG